MMQASELYQRPLPAGPVDGGKHDPEELTGLRKATVVETEGCHEAA